MLIVKDLAFYKEQLDYFKQQCFENHIDKQKVRKALFDSITEETDTFEARLVIEHVKKELGI